MSDPAKTNTQNVLEAFTGEMYEIVRNHRYVKLTNLQISSMSLAEAYDIQSRVLEARAQEGERIVGWKVGCTSSAIMQQFGLSQPISGRLMYPFIHPDNSCLKLNNYVDCAIEPEIVFRLGADLAGEVDLNNAADAIATVAPGIEMHNFRFWYGTPTSQELIASNGIHAGLVVGQERPFNRDIDLAMEGVGVWVDGCLAASGIGAEIMGRGPLNSLCWLARHVEERGEKLRAGELVIPGSAVRLVRVQTSNQIDARFTRLGKCSVAVI